ncbi:MAG: response regulator transcription factor [Oscillospiraceae bacterium]|nr:response regulator transcription factor [Oscillospiraceae bacterium]
MIYLVEDDDSIRKLVVYALESQGFAAQGFARPSDFRTALRQQIPDLVLLDIMLPQEDGLAILRSLRSEPLTRRLPVIMLTAKNSEYDRAYGLDAGADDYISKPFGMMELLARVRAVLRRAGISPAETEYRLDRLRVLPGKHQVTVDGQAVPLTNKEFRLLELLMEANGAVLTRSVLMDRIWGQGGGQENRTLDVHIRTLRAKLGEAGKFIETVRGVGYRISDGETR